MSSCGTILQGAVPPTDDGCVGVRMLQGSMRRHTMNNMGTAAADLVVDQEAVRTY
jgi:hypothetical protein